MVFHGSRLVFMVLHGSRLVFMVFLQNVPAQTVSWPNDPVSVRRPEGFIGPSFFKWCKPSTDLYKYSDFSSLKHTDTTWQQQRKPSSFAMIGRSWPVCWWLSQSIFSMNLCKVSPLDLLFKKESSLSIGPLTKRHVWNFPNLSIMCQKCWAGRKMFLGTVWTFRWFEYMSHQLN